MARALIKKAALNIRRGHICRRQSDRKGDLVPLTEEKKEQVGSQIIINVAHRLNTIEQSDRVIFL